MLTSSINNHTEWKFKKRNTNYLISPLPRINLNQYLPNKKILSTHSTLSLLKQLHYEHDPQPLTTLNTSIPINRPFLGKPNNVKVSISLESVTLQFQYVRRGFNKGEGALLPGNYPSLRRPWIESLIEFRSTTGMGGVDRKESRGKIGFSRADGYWPIDRRPKGVGGGGRGWKTNGCAYVNVCYVRQGVAQPEAANSYASDPTINCPNFDS